MKIIKSVPWLTKITLRYKKRYSAKLLIQIHYVEDGMSHGYSLLLFLGFKTLRHLTSSINWTKAVKNHILKSKPAQKPIKNGGMRMSNNTRAQSIDRVSLHASVAPVYEEDYTFCHVCFTYDPGVPPLPASFHALEPDSVCSMIMYDTKWISENSGSLTSPLIALAL